MLLNSLRSRKFLGRQSRKFLRTGLARRQQRCHHVSSLFRHHVTMSLGHFHNQAVCSQQSQTSSHRRHLLTLFSAILGGCVKVSANIAVAKAVEQKFPTVNDTHQLGIAIPQRIERSVALTLVLNGPTHPSGWFFKRGLHMDRSQRRQMPFSGRPTHFGPSIKVGHASAQDAPLLGTAGVILRTTKAFKLSGLVNRCFNPQHAPLVVELKRVLVHPVLDPHPITAAAPVGHHFIADPYPARTAPKPKHLFGSKTHHSMMHQRRINPFKRLPITKHDVGSVFGLGRRPVVLLPDRSVDLSIQRMASSHQRTQKLTPLALVLLIHQHLGTPNIANPRIAVLLSPVAHPGSVHLTPEPFSTVQTDLNQKWKPSLKSKMQKTKLLMHPVKIQVNAFAPLKLNLQLAGHSIPPQKPRATRFHATQNSYQPLAHLVALLNLANHFLFARATRSEIDHRTLMPPCQLLCRLTHTAGQIGCESLKILPQHSSLPKVLFHDRLIIQAAQCPLQPKTIPTVQDSNHIGFMPLHECTGYLVICRVGCTHAHPLYQRTDSVIWLRRSRAGSFVIRFSALASYAFSPRRHTTVSTSAGLPALTCSMARRNAGPTAAGSSMGPSAYQPMPFAIWAKSGGGASRSIPICARAGSVPRW